MTLIRCLAILVVCNCVIVGAEPQKTSKRQFPAKITITTSELLDDGRRELELTLALEKDVEIFANPVGDTFPESCAMKVSIATEEETVIPAEIDYPKPSRSEDLDQDGKVHIFSGTVKIRLRFTPSQSSDLKVRCKVQGWNSRALHCLGSATLETPVSDGK